MGVDKVVDTLMEQPLKLSDIPLDKLVVDMVGDTLVVQPSFEFAYNQTDSQVVGKVVGTLMELKPWSVGIPLDRKVLGKVEDTSEEQPSSLEEASWEHPVHNLKDRMEACMV